MNMCPSNKCKTSPELCLEGQVFFIWTNYPSLETVKDKISLLGGKVEQFLSRDVTTILVEDNQLLTPELLSPELSVKSTYAANGTIVASFSHPNNSPSLPSTSRGYILASNTSTKSVYSPYRIICYAQQWGIQVLGIYQFLTWIEPQFKTVIRQKQRKAAEHISNLSGCFIKFESLHKNYRPCYKMFNNDPDRLLPLKNASILIKPENFNVILDKPSRQVHFSHMDTIVKTAHQSKVVNLPVKANDKKPQNNKLKPKEESNYCDCCRTHFADLKQHIKSSKHQSFVSNDKNYESVHNILKMLPTPQEFIEKLQNPSSNSNSVLTNGDISHCTTVANVPETDYSVPLNLQIRKENIVGAVIPINMHIEKNDILSHNLQVMKDENMPLPLDLHVKKDDIKIETKEVKQDTNLFVNYEQVESSRKENPSVVQPKVEIKNESVLENTKINEKLTAEIASEVHCDEMNGDALFDRTNTAALAQQCLKNFDSYWLDSLPCEMEDIIFDDIFDFDDGKTKVDNECIGTFAESFVNSDVAQTPGLVSDISTPNLRTQTTENTSILVNNAIDIKDCIKTEPPTLQSFPPTCKLEKDFETVPSHNLTSSLNETPLENKKQIFSIASFCSDAAPSCSNTLPNKNPEPLFSSESSDDENGNVLISNALNMITNSDSDMKVDKESSEENSIQEQCEIKVLPNVLSNCKNYIETTHIKDDQSSKEMQAKCKESSLIMHNSAENKNQTNNSQIKINSLLKNKLVKPFAIDEMKAKCQNRMDVSETHKLILDTKCKENIDLENKYSCSEATANEVSEDVFLRKNSDVINKHNFPVNFSITDEKLSCKPKIDPEDHKRNISNDKKEEWELLKNRISQKYQVSTSKTVEDVKEGLFQRKSVKESPILVQSNLPQEIKVSKENSEKCLIPKKNVSMCEMKVKQNDVVQSCITTKALPAKPCENKADHLNYRTVVNTARKPHLMEEKIFKKPTKNSEMKINLKSSHSKCIPTKVLACEKKVDHVRYETITSCKRSYSKEKKFYKKIKEDNSLHKQFNFSEMNPRKDVKEQSVLDPVNPCQYLNRNKIYDVASSNKLPVDPPINKQTIKIPHKKESSKLRKLPPLWSVSIVPGSGVKLKFTCIHSKKVDAHQFETDDDSD